MDIYSETHSKALLQRKCQKKKKNVSEEFGIGGWTFVGKEVKGQKVR